MINIQEWLTNKYNKYEEKRIVINISEDFQNIATDNLTISDWPNLEEISFLNLLCPPCRIDKVKADAYLEKHKKSINSLFISNCSQLRKITSNYIAQIEQLSLTNCPRLHSLHFSTVGLKKVTIRECPNLDFLNLAGNELTKLDLRRLPELKWLVVNDNQLKELDICQNTKLRNFWCDSSLQPIKTLQKREEVLITEISNLREEVIGYKLKEQERKFDDFVRRLGVGREKLRELRKAYQKLIKALENYNQNDIMEAEDEIEKIKDELIDGGIDIVNVQKLCQKCEKFAKLKEEQNEIYKWKFEAKQEVPTNS